MMSLVSLELSQTQSNRTLFMHVDLTPTIQLVSHADLRGYMSSGLQQTPSSRSLGRRSRTWHGGRPEPKRRSNCAVRRGQK